MTMHKPASYRRHSVLRRPWIEGKLYDDLTRPTILHCDAYVFTFAGNEYLQLEWRVRGIDLLALDTWLIEPDGLTPVWEMQRSKGALKYSRNAALHARVVAQAAEAERLGMAQCSRVSLLCHYVDAREQDGEAYLGAPLPTLTRARRRASVLPDVL